MCMKRGDILFIRGNSFISKIINSIDGPYSHIAIALSEDTILEAQRFTESRIIKNYHVDYDVYQLDLTESQLDGIVDASLVLIGHDYDYTQIVATLFNNLFKIARRNNRSKYICSEIIVELLHRIGYIDLKQRETIIHYTPNELNKFLQCVKNRGCVSVSR